MWANKTGAVVDKKAAHPRLRKRLAGRGDICNVKSKAGREHISTVISLYCRPHHSTKFSKEWTYTSKEI